MCGTLLREISHPGWLAYLQRPPSADSIAFFCSVPLAPRGSLFFPQSLRGPCCCQGWNEIEISLSCWQEEAAAAVSAAPADYRLMMWDGRHTRHCSNPQAINQYYSALNIFLKNIPVIEQMSHKGYNYQSGVRYQSHSSGRTCLLYFFPWRLPVKLKVN